MANIIHRYINGKKVEFEELSRYQITNRTILDIVCAAIKRSTAYDTTPAKLENNESADGYSNAAVSNW
ncbi:MAG: hypothetical protein ACI39W_01680 [Brotaphodocola sp.]